MSYRDVYYTFAQITVNGNYTVRLINRQINMKIYILYDCVFV